jgi:hypothetical protein
MATGVRFRKNRLSIIALVCAGWFLSQNVLFGQSVQYFPFWGSGGGYITTWYFAGLGSGPATLTLELFTQNGGPFDVATDLGTNSVFTLGLERTDEISLRTLGEGSLQVGWAKVTSSQPVGATEVFQYFNSHGTLLSEGGVLPSSLAAVATLFVSNRSSGLWKDTGLALANVGNSKNDLILKAINQDGEVSATSDLSLGPGCQTSRYVDQFPGMEDLGDFEGTLEISGRNRFSAVSVGWEGTEMSVLPVLPGRVAEVTSATVTVPAIADMTLAGMPAGYRFLNDSAPLDSPVDPGIAVVPGYSVELNASGEVTINNFGDKVGPSGHSSYSDTMTWMMGFPENGISDVKAPFGGLLGVFIGQEQPSMPRPDWLDFSGAAKDLVRVEPQLKQVFYIGTGKTSQGATKQFIVPDGATRIFLAPLFFAGNYSGNNGSFTVSLSISPAP